MWNNILEICNELSQITYENLTKIIRYAEQGNSRLAQIADDSFQNDVDHWMGGGTCFSMTWLLYQKLQAKGLKPKLLMGHKRKEKNIHCGLCLFFEGKSFFFDPGYLIFDPLEMPEGFLPENNSLFYPLVPNVVRLMRNDHILSLFTGSHFHSLKLRFEFPENGVTEKDFLRFWTESFEREMMTYPVLNRLDRTLGVQYYFQKENLMIRDKNGSRMEKIPEKNQISVLSEIFRVSPDIVERALGVLKKSY